MTAAPRTALRPLADSSPSAIVAGFVAMLTAYTSSLVLMFQAGQAAGLDSAQISSWIWALSIGMAICTIGLSLRYRAPIVVAWSTPGAALLVGSLLAGLLGLLDFRAVTLEPALPRWTTPGFSLEAMASQNIPGLVVLRADGYQVPASPLVATTGLASLLLAPFGAHGVNLAAISAAICTGHTAHEDPQRRYTAALWCGLFYAVAGTFAATLASLFAALTGELVLSIAALALFGSIGSGLSSAMAEPREREAALVTFMISASGMTLLSIGAAFWGLLGGVLTLAILEWRRPA